MYIMITVFLALTALVFYDKYKDEIAGWERSAHKLNYEKWLDGYLKRGGNITHYYKYPLTTTVVRFGSQGSREKTVIDSAIISSSLKPVFSKELGANSKHILYTSKQPACMPNIGHNNYYFMDGFTQIGGFVPCYKDMKQYLNKKAQPSEPD